MVRDVRYITLSSTYRDVQEALMTGQLKTLALVESKGAYQQSVLKQPSWPCPQPMPSCVILTDCSASRLILSLLPVYV